MIGGFFEYHAPIVVVNILFVQIVIVRRQTTDPSLCIECGVDVVTFVKVFNWREAGLDTLVGFLQVFNNFVSDVSFVRMRRWVDIIVVELFFFCGGALFHALVVFVVGFESSIKIRKNDVGTKDH